MQYIYKTVTEDITIDISEEWASFLQDWDRMEYNNDHAESRRHYHLEACVYEGQDFATDDDVIERLLEKCMLEPALEKLTTVQRDMIDALFYRGMTAQEYAASRGIRAQSASDIKLAALKKLKNFLECA